MNKLAKAVLCLLFGAMMLAPVMGASAQTTAVNLETFDKICYTDDFERFEIKDLQQKDYYSIVAKPGCRISIVDTQVEEYGKALKFWSKAGSSDPFGDLIAESSNMFVELNRGYETEVTWRMKISEDTFVRFVIYRGDGGVLGTIFASDTSAASVNEGNIRELSEERLEDGWVNLRFVFDAPADYDPFISFTVREGRESLVQPTAGDHYLLLDDIVFKSKGMTRVVRDYADEPAASQNFDAAMGGDDILSSIFFTKIDQQVKSRRITNEDDGQKRAINSTDGEHGSMLIEFSDGNLPAQEFTPFMRLGPEKVKLVRGYYKISFDYRDYGAFAYYIALKDMQDKVTDFVYFDSNTQGNLMENNGTVRLDHTVEVMQDDNPESACGGTYKHVTIYMTVREQSYLDFTLRQYYPGERSEGNYAWTVIDNFEVFRAEPPVQLSCSYQDYLYDDFRKMEAMDASNWKLGANAQTSGNSVSGLDDGLLTVNVGTQPAEAVLELKNGLTSVQTEPYRIVMMFEASNISTVYLEFYDESGVLSSVPFNLLSRTVSEGDDLTPYRSSYSYNVISGVHVIGTEAEVNQGAGVRIRAQRTVAMMPGTLEIKTISVLKSYDEVFDRDPSQPNEKNPAEYGDNGGVFDTGKPKDDDILILDPLQESGCKKNSAGAGMEIAVCCAAVAIILKARR